MWMVCIADDPSEISNLIFLEKKKRMLSAAFVDDARRIIFKV